MLMPAIDSKVVLIMVAYLLAVLMSVPKRCR